MQDIPARAYVSQFALPLLSSRLLVRQWGSEYKLRGGADNWNRNNFGKIVNFLSRTFDLSSTSKFTRRSFFHVYDVEKKIALTEIILLSISTLTEVQQTSVRYQSVCRTNRDKRRKTEQLKYCELGENLGWIFQGISLNNLRSFPSVPQEVLLRVQKVVSSSPFIPVRWNSRAEEGDFHFTILSPNPYKGRS